MRLIDADDFGNRMYHEAFEKDSDLQKWDSGCWIRYKLFENVLREQPTIQPVATDTNVGDTISRKGVFIPNITVEMFRNASLEGVEDLMASGEMEDISLPSAQPEQRYTEEELRVFAHGISLSLLSKRSAQHWRYDEDTATEIEFLERLYDKVSAHMKGIKAI